MIDLIGKSRLAVAEAERQGYGIATNTGKTRCWDDEGRSSAKIDKIVQDILDAYDPIPKAKSNSVDKINRICSAARVNYMTMLPGQDAVYHLKLSDAREFIDKNLTSDPNNDFPFVGVEAEAMGSSLAEAAAYILTAAAQYKSEAIKIERIRRVNIIRIGRATTEQECTDIITDTETALN